MYAATFEQKGKKGCILIRMLTKPSESATSFPGSCSPK